MRKVITLVAIMALCAWGAGDASAASDELLPGMGQKLWRGIVNTFTGWVEFPAQIIKGYNEGFMDDEGNKIGGVIVGVFDGIGHSAGRTIHGTMELATFWAADPMSNDGVGIPLDAEYAWEAGDPYNIFEPTLMDGAVMPVGRKLFRGLGNGLLGVAELPGQIVKGVQQGAPDLGIVKGVWYTLSREAHGLKDVTTCILPNPDETKALAFDEEWPWDALAESIQ